MKFEQGQMLLNNKRYEATKVDFDSYSYERGEITLQQINCPHEYQEVEYIESTGTQHIDTKIYATQNTNYEIDMKLVSIAHNSQQCVASSLDANFVPKIYSWSGLIGQTAIDLKTSRLYIYGLETNRGKIKVVGLNLYYNDKLHGTFKVTRDEGKDTLPIWLFNSPSEPNLGAAMRLYRFKVWEGETLVRDFIPCYIKKTKEVGLWDKVSQKFFKNSGTGSFLHGDIVYCKKADTYSATKVIGND